MSSGPLLQTSSQRGASRTILRDRVSPGRPPHCGVQDHRHLAQDHPWRHDARRKCEGDTMGFRYRKSFKAGPIRVTASKSGVSYSAGVKGARIAKRADGRVQTTLSVPRTGLGYTTTKARKAKTAGHRAGKVQHAAATSVPLPGQRSSVLPYPPPPGTCPLVFKGYLASVTLRPDRIQIDRTFMGRVNGNHSARILWGQLAGVDFLDPTRLINGHVHFAAAIDPRGLTATGSGRRLAAAARNPHAIMFTWQQRAAYERLRGLLVANQVVSSNGVPYAAPGSASPASPLPARPSAGSSSERVRSLPAVPLPGPEPAWLPGDVEVQVSGETFHAEAIQAADRSGRPASPTWPSWSLNQVTRRTTAR